MGYQTNFMGRWECSPPLSLQQVNYLVAFSQTRRVKRNIDEVVVLPDSLREAVGLPAGFQGGYYVGSINDGINGQADDPSILDGNLAPGQESYLSTPTVSIQDGGQPGLWCQWIPTEDGHAIEWDEGEKFYGYVDWIAFLIHHFLEPWGVKLNGTVEWDGEEFGDQGGIIIDDNAISIARVEVNPSETVEVYTP